MYAVGTKIVSNYNKNHLVLGEEVERRGWNQDERQSGGDRETAVAGLSQNAPFLVRSLLILLPTLLSTKYQESQMNFKLEREKSFYILYYLPAVRRTTNKYHPTGT